MGKNKDWFVVWNKDKNDYFAIEDKHEGVSPRMIGNMEVVGIVSFEKPAYAIDWVKFIHSEQPMRRGK